MFHPLATAISQLEKFSTRYINDDICQIICATDLAHLTPDAFDEKRCVDGKSH